jgi:glyoxylase-like metal-dependent hydrolase (beta-lactamase superfamily II)
MLQTAVFTLGMFQVNNYVLFDPETREAVLIDTGKDPQVIVDFIREKQLDLKLILYTHTHIDHVEGHGDIRPAFSDVPAWMHPEEQFWVDALPQQAQMFQMDVPEPPKITGLVEPGQVFALTNFSLEARFCPGHTPGGISYYVAEGPYLFTGDSLFKGTIGRTDFPKGDFDTLMRSIETQLMTLPDETVVYPGHGPKTTVGAEKASNPFVLQYLGSR